MLLPNNKALFSVAEAIVFFIWIEIPYSSEKTTIKKRFVNHQMRSSDPNNYFEVNNSIFVRTRTHFFGCSWVYAIVCGVIAKLRMRVNVCEREKEAKLMNKYWICAIYV